MTAIFPSKINQNPFLSRNFFQLFFYLFAFNLPPLQLENASPNETQKNGNIKNFQRKTKTLKSFFLYISTKTHFSLGGLGVSNWILTKIVSEQVHFNKTQMSNFVDKLFNLVSAFVISTSVWFMKKFDNNLSFLKLIWLIPTHN